MNRNNLRNFIASTAIASGLCFTAARTASAVPVTGKYAEDPRCDQIPNQQLTHELGDQLTFPLNEAILVNTQPVNFTVCVPDDGIANDWVIEIQNVSGIVWKDLFFVVDHHVLVGNADGAIEDAIGAPGLFEDAFRIDGTLTAGVNNNLLSETGGIANNEIFEVGETWRFAASNFMAVTSAGLQPPLINTPGIFAGSALFPSTSGNCSILANPVPEPATLSIVLLSASALLLRRPRKTQNSTL